MKTIITTCFLILLTLSVPCLSSAQQDQVSFASSSIFVREASPAIHQFSYSIERDRIFLNWTTVKNQDMDQFEIERSTDGKNFVTAAVFFGTDKPGADSYKYYEKSRSKKTCYRIKIIQKDGSASYSPLIVTQG